MIPLFKVYMPPMVGKSVKEVLFSGYVAEGEHVRAFEKSLRNFMQHPNIITTNSCTSALHLALKLFGADYPGSHVITTPMTCVATNVAITNLGATPIWTDVDPKHGMMTAQTLRNAYEACRDKCDKITAVVYVCWGGDIGPINEVAAVCKELGLPLIIDAAQAFGKHVAKFDVADIVCYSFQAIKHVTTGDGGAMLFKETVLMDTAFKLKWFGIDRNGFRTPTGEIDWKADIPEIGFKFHMNNIAGVIGTAQINDPAFEQRLSKYKANDLFLTSELPSQLKRSWKGLSESWVATFNCDCPLELLQYLKDCGIHTSQMHVNNDVYSGFKGIKPLPLIGVKSFMRTHICLPCGWWVNAEDMLTMINVIKEFYG